MNLRGGTVSSAPRRCLRTHAKNATIAACASIGLFMLAFSGHFGARSVNLREPSTLDAALTRVLTAPAPSLQPWQVKPIFETGRCAIARETDFTAGGACTTFVIVVGSLEEDYADEKMDVFQGRIERLYGGQLNKEGDIRAFVVFEDKAIASCGSPASDSMTPESWSMLCALQVISKHPFDWAVRIARPTTIVNLRRLEKELETRWPRSEDDLRWGGFLLRNLSAEFDSNLRTLGTVPPFPTSDAIVIASNAVRHAAATPLPERSARVSEGASLAVWLLSSGAVPFHLAKLAPYFGCIDEQMASSLGPLAIETTLGFLDWTTKALDEKAPWERVCREYARQENFEGKRGLRDCLECKGQCASPNEGVSLRLDRTLILPKKLFRWNGVHLFCEEHSSGLSISRLA